MGIAKTLGETVAYHRQRLHRIEALADGVFAIVMTLLVLDIRIPIRDLNSEIGMWHALVMTVPKIFIFILTFLVAGQFWSIFINQFNYLNDSDRNENILALIYLMFVSLLPFSTSFLSEHLWSRVATGLYILNTLLILIFHTLHWLYSYHTGLVRVKGIPCVIIHKAIMRRAWIVFAAYGFIIVFCFFNSYLALLGSIIINAVFTFNGFVELLNPDSKQSIRVNNRKIARTEQEALEQTRTEDVEYSRNLSAQNIEWTS